MPCCCHSVNKRIIIVRGDDTDFNDRTLLTLRLSSDVLDLSTFKATLTLFSLVREYDDLTQNLTVNYSAEETMTLPYGNITGVLRLYDTSKRVDTIETNIPFQVVSEVEAREIELRDSYYSVEITDGEETILNIAIESAISVRIGQVQTLQPDEPAYVTNMGSNNHLVLNFGIPQGVKGVQGERGATGANGQDGRDGTNGRSAELQIGVVQTLQPTQSAYVINTGTSLNAVLDFGIPRGEKGEQGERGLQGLQGEQGIQGIQGEKGDKGDKGDKGNTGATGQAATVQVGTVTTLSPSESAYVQNVGTTSQAIFNFGIPKGDTGSGANADFSDITGSPYDCDALATVLNGKQNVIEDLSDIRSGAEAGATAVQPSSLAEVATSGSYNDLLNKPTIPPAQVNADWDASSGVAQILNKPNLATVATSGSYTDLSNKPTIPDAQVQSDWSESDNTKVDYIKNKPTLATVATSGSYNDLSNKPTIPTTTSSVTSGSTEALTSGGAYSGLVSLVYASNKNDYEFFVDKNGITTKITINNVPNASNSTTASKLGSSTVGSSTQPIYLNNGTPTAGSQLANVATSGSYNDLSNKPDLSGYQTTTNLVTSVSSASTDIQYPSAKCLYDLCGDIETLINAL